MGDLVKLRGGSADAALRRVSDEEPTSVLIAYCDKDGKVGISGAVTRDDEGYALVGALEAIKSWLVNLLNEEA